MAKFGIVCLVGYGPFIEANSSRIGKLARIQTRVVSSRLNSVLLVQSAEITQLFHQHNRVVNMSAYMYALISKKKNSHWA